MSKDYNYYYYDDEIFRMEANKSSLFAKLEMYKSGQGFVEPVGSYKANLQFKGRQISEAEAKNLIKKSILKK